MSTTFSPVMASAHITATVVPDEPVRFEESYGWDGKTRTVEVNATHIGWSINLTAETPKWVPNVRTTCRWVRKDGTLGAATHSLYAFPNTPNGQAIRAHEAAAVEATRPTVIPSFIVNPEA